MEDTSKALDWNVETFRLDGKVAAVTGAGQGLGRAFSLALARAGAQVVLLDIARENIEEVAREIEAVGSRAWSEVCDVTDRGQVAEALSSPERLDVLVNNAGTNITQPFLEVSEENLHKMLSLNVKGYFLVAQAAARRMVESGEGGSIVNVTSQMGHVGAPIRTVYCTTKHAIEGLTRAMAIELAPRGVRVNSLAPTFVDTPLTKPMFEDEEFLNDTLSRIPMGRLGRLQDVMGAVVFLASPAAAMVTGASLLVDGGWTAR
ncbi:MAG: SDR family NAD(P)-dependent oxidoreductase [Rubrobacteraceae bacterium]